MLLWFVSGSGCGGVLPEQTPSLWSGWSRHHAADDEEAVSFIPQDYSQPHAFGKLELDILAGWLAAFSSHSLLTL